MGVVALASIGTVPAHAQAVTSPAYQASGLAPVIEAVARFERNKRTALARLSTAINREEWAGRLESLFAGMSDGAEAADSCNTVRVLRDDRSSKAGEAAQVIRLELHCKGLEDGVLLLPDDPAREVQLFIDSRSAQNKSPVPQYGNRYYLTRGLGVTKSLHDVDGDGKPDTLGIHVGGQARPVKASPLTVSSM
jgi:hypothetical protein